MRCLVVKATNKSLLSKKQKRESQTGRNIHGKDQLVTLDFPKLKKKRDVLKGQITKLTDFNYILEKIIWLGIVYTLSLDAQNVPRREHSCWAFASSTSWSKLAQNYTGSTWL